MNPVRPLIRTAVDLQAKEHYTQLSAIDFGVGAGTETSYLLASGYKVLAIDNFEEFLTELSLHQANTPYLIQLNTILAPFEELRWETISPVDLFVASHSLYFIQAESFYSVWNQICIHIKPGGLFVGEFSTHLIANRQIDGFFVDEKLTLVPFMSESQMKELLNGFEIIHFSPTAELYESSDEDRTEEVLYSVLARKK